MEDWKVLYASKLMTADEAVRQIPDGSRVFFGHAANEPPVLDGCAGAETMSNIRMWRSSTGFPWEKGSTAIPR